MLFVCVCVCVCINIEGRVFMDRAVEAEKQV